MKVFEAKDFLVQQTAEQAALENVPLSDLEKRMMYFTETGDCPEDPIALNDAFEARYDTDEYEAKISKLMHHAYQQNRKGNPEATRQWNNAIRTLRKGDHYILVFWDQGPQERPPYDSLKLLGTALLVIALLVPIMFVLDFIGNRYGIHLGGRRWYRAPYVQTSMPLWLQRLVILLMVGGYFYVVVWPWVQRKLPLRLKQTLLRMPRGRKQG
jgi:hypothetical protein